MKNWENNLMKYFLWYVYNVLIGNSANNEASFFDAGGDIIFEPNDDTNSIDFLMDNGRTYRIIITEVEK